MTWLKRRTCSGFPDAASKTGRALRFMCKDSQLMHTEQPWGKIMQAVRATEISAPSPATASVVREHRSRVHFTRPAYIWNANNVLCNISEIRDLVRWPASSCSFALRLRECGAIVRLGACQRDHNTHFKSQWRMKEDSRVSSVEHATNDDAVDGETEMGYQTTVVRFQPFTL